MITLPVNPPFACVFGCSPRKGGNSDLAALLIEGELFDLGLPVDSAFLRDSNLYPCHGCQLCGSPEIGGKLCVFNGKDDGEKLFEALLGANRLFFISPIYFYHLPALFKRFIDRGQAYWEARERGAPLLAGLPRGQAHVVLLAGRKTGEKLFQGSLLTLRLFLEIFNVDMAEPLLLRGLDGPADLAGNHGAQEEIIAYVREACREGSGG